MLFKHLKQSHPTGADPFVYSSREEGANRSKAPLYFYQAPDAPGEARYAFAVAETPVPGRFQPYPRKRPAEVSELELRVELYREETRFRTRRDRLVNSSVSVYQGEYYMTVRYSAEHDVYEVVPAEDLAAQVRRLPPFYPVCDGTNREVIQGALASWAWMALTTMLGALKSGYVFITEKLLGRRKYSLACFLGSP